jgi:hypothetical protein
MAGMMIMTVPVVASTMLRPPIGLLRLGALPGGIHRRWCGCLLAR